MAMSKTTSLSAQLKSLQSPATSQFTHSKGRPSFIYTYQEAAGIDCDTHYVHCLSGLDALERSHPDLDLSHFRESLFTESSKSFERGLRSKEDNEVLDTVVESFLFQVITPYFLQESCHKILEYLIYKYYINEFNNDALILSVLPYHETNLFPKLLQTLPDMKDGSSKWKTILHLCQKKGAHLPKASLLQACISNPWLLDEITQTAKTISKKCQKQNVFITFTAAVFVGVLSNMSPSTPIDLKESSKFENILMSVLSYIEVGLKAKSQHFVVAAYSVAAMISCKQVLADEIVSVLLTRVCKLFEKYTFREDVREHFVLLLAIIIDNQDVSVIPDAALSAIMSSGMDVLKERPQFVSKLMITLAGKGLDNSIDQLYDLSISNPKALEYVKEINKSISLEKLPVSPESRLKLFLFMLSLSNHHTKIIHKMKQLTGDATLAVNAIDSLTIVDNGIGLTQRLPFDVKTTAWRSVMVVLEVFSKSKGKLSNAEKLIKCCVQLLGESFVFHEEADCEYFRLLLNRTISKCLDCLETPSRTVASSEVMQRVMESLRHFRKRESISETLRFIRRIMENTVKEKQTVLDNLMLLFGFSFGSGAFVFDDDDAIMALLEELLHSVMTSFVGSESDQKLLLDTVIDSLYDVLPSRRMPLITAVIDFLNKKSAEGNQGDWMPYTILSLVHKPVIGSMKEIREFNQNFASQVLLTRLEEEDKVDLVLDILTDLTAILSSTINPSAIQKDDQKESVEPMIVDQKLEQKANAENMTVRRSTRLASRKTSQSDNIPVTSKAAAFTAISSSQTPIQEEKVTPIKSSKIEIRKTVSLSKMIGNSWYSKLRDNIVSLTTRSDQDLLTLPVISSILTTVLTDSAFDSAVVTPVDTEVESRTEKKDKESCDTKTKKPELTPKCERVIPLHRELMHFMTIYSRSDNNERNKLIAYSMYKCLKAVSQRIPHPHHKKLKRDALKKQKQEKDNNIPEDKEIKD